MKRLIIDTETAGTIKKPLVYDCGFAVVDEDFNILHSASYVINEVFYGMNDLMKTAYYASKLPQYYKDIENGKREVISFADKRTDKNLRTIIYQICQEYNVKEAWAYHACFDKNALNNTLSVLSNGAALWFMPFGIEWKCIQGASASTFLNSRTYFKWALERNLISDCGNVRTTVESAYKYMTKDDNFIEAHTALADVLVEMQLLQKALSYRTKMYTLPTQAAYRPCQEKFKAYCKKING